MSASRFQGRPWRLVRGGAPTDALLAGALAIVAMVALRIGPVPDGGRDADAFAYLLGLVLTVPLAVRQRWPVLVLGAMVAGSAAYASRGYPTANIDFFGPIIAFYTVASTRARPVVGASAAFLLAAVVASIAISPVEGEAASAALNGAVIILATWFLGDSVRRRRQATALLQERTRELEAARLELAERAVTEERLRIARDLHDVVAHHISAVIVQSSVAAELVGRDDSAAATAIANVRDVSRRALADTRQVLGVLRTGPGASDGSSPGLRDIAAVAASVCANGTPVDLRVEPASGAAPSPELEEAAFRVVQEALTNVLRHAPGAETAVIVSPRAAGGLALSVTNGPPPHVSAAGDGAPGFGLAGMRERVEMLGGTFEAGPVQGGGFRVAATLPPGAAR
jgi:signal transduction histidine kinase